MEQEAVRILLIGSGAQRYALPLDAVREVFDAREIAPVPLTPPAMSGVIDIRGRIVPVIDIAHLLNGSAAADGGQIVVVMVPGEDTDVGLRVDQVPGLSSSRRTIPPRDPLPRFVSSLLETGDGAVPLLDIRELLQAV